MKEEILTSTGLEAKSGTVVRFWRPTPAEQLKLYLRHGFEVDPETADDILYSFELFHSLWWVDSSSCTARSGECDCGPMALSDVISLVGPEVAVEAIKVHTREMRVAWEHFWAGEGLLTGSKKISGCCALCIGEGIRHIDAVGEEARNLSIELGEAMGAHPNLFGL